MKKFKLKKRCHISSIDLIFKNCWGHLQNTVENNIINDVDDKTNILVISEYAFNIAGHTIHGVNFKETNEKV